MHGPISTWMPACCNCLMPPPATWSVGSGAAIITFAIFAAMTACEQGGVFPVWQHGSSVTYIVASVGSLCFVLQPVSAFISACGPPNCS